MHNIVTHLICFSTSFYNTKCLNNFLYFSPITDFETFFLPKNTLFSNKINIFNIVAYSKIVEIIF